MWFEVFDDAESLSRASAAFITRAAQEAVAARGLFTLVLSGGSSPLGAYGLIGADPAFPWPSTHLFWGDERCVPPDHEESNRRAALESLGPPERLPRDNIHPMRGQLSPREAAQDYEWRLRGFFEGEERPPWDLLLLGLGPDGHTASLFPGVPALDEAEAWVAPVDAPSHIGPHLPRVTLTLPAINAARRVLFIAAGANKQPVVAAIRADQQRAAQNYPAARVRPRGEMIWHLDRAAAGD
ncbi:MAG: 6-phosphogluconolactonase [Desulfarculaceae bacterium]|nr:6-phosphogluconolactonase [Desulfarculaceae bacterium]MCF8072974.1 6-phosphogluconolactonase [Desulfarculaceae bacterium]MCF8100730.1 6-phosphogluconolactonase [Desulfarculaceae bacterium]MCF8115468.1 6-phosphogluconolactonase [Desulfarculaceae bacterium]